MANTVTVNIVGDASDLNRALGSADSALGKLGSSLVHIGVLATAAIGAAGIAIGAFGLKAAADMQQVEVAFEGILGSGEKAEEFLNRLKDFAARTPFEFPELARAAKSLLAVGFATEDVIPIMTKLGNVAATLGVGGEAIEGVVRALGQMKGKGKASAEELQQISEQIPGFSAIGAIAEKMGVSVAEAFDAMADGAIPADFAIEAILEGMEKFPGAAGAMERQAQTLNGVLSTLKDTMKQALVDGIAPALPAISAAVNEAMPAISAALTGVGESFGKLMQAATPLIDVLVPILGQIADTVSGVLTEAFALLVPIIADLAPHFSDFLAAVKPLVSELLEGLAPVIATLAPALVDLATTFAEALLPIVSDLVPVLQIAAEALAYIADNIDASGAAAIIGAAAFVKIADAAEEMGTKMGIANTVGLGPLMIAVGLGVGVVAGLTQAFSDQSANLDVNIAKMQELTNLELVHLIQKTQEAGEALGDTGIVADTFADILSKDVVQAQRYKDAADQAGISTEGWDGKIQRQLSSQAKATLENEKAKQKTDELALSLGLIPESQRLAIETHGFELAIEQAIATKAAIDAIHDKEVNIITHLREQWHPAI